MEEQTTAPAPTPVAAPEKKKGGAAGILCVVFALIALGACGYIVYSKVIAKPAPTTNCINDTTENNGENSGDEGNNSVASTGFVFSGSYGTYYVTKTGDTYLVPGDWRINVGGLDFVGIKIDSSAISGKYGSYKITDKDITDYVFAYGYGEEVDGSFTEISGYKLDITNVVSIYDVGFGQSWNGWNTVFVKKDGTVDWLYVMPDFTNGTNTVKTKLTKNVGEYKDVASVMSTMLADGGGVTLVTKDGGHIKMSVDMLSTLSTM